MSNIDNSWPYLSAPASPRRLELLKVMKARPASAPCRDLTKGTVFVIKERAFKSKPKKVARAGMSIKLPNKVKYISTDQQVGNVSINLPVLSF